MHKTDKLYNTVSVITVLLSDLSPKWHLEAFLLFSLFNPSMPTLSGGRDEWIQFHDVDQIY